MIAHLPQERGLKDPFVPAHRHWSLIFRFGFRRRETICTRARSSTLQPVLSCGGVAARRC